jgi:electron transport complex protein RnfC
MIPHPIEKIAHGFVISCNHVKKKKYSLRPGIELFSKESLKTIIENNGIVGMGGAAFPTHVKVNPPKKIDTLIINGCECEPYLATDYRLMVENLEPIMKGIEIIAKIVSPTKIIFAVEDNKHEAIKKINLFLSLKKFSQRKLSLKVLETAYPQGGEKQLIDSLLGREVPPKGIPYDVGCLVQNVGTCLAIYDAVFWNKPFIERMVSFCGDALAAPKNIWVKVGTTLQELFDNNVLQFKQKPKKIICGGPMMGVALPNLNFPVLKGSGGFLFLTKEIRLENETNCIRCGRCVDVCPMNLLPLEYVKRVKNNKYEQLKDLGIGDCMECGSCSYVCPAKIPLVQYIKQGKFYQSE